MDDIIQKLDTVNCLAPELSTQRAAAHWGTMSVSLCVFLPDRTPSFAAKPRAASYGLSYGPAPDAPVLSAAYSAITGLFTGAWVYGVPELRQPRQTSRHDTVCRHLIRVSQGTRVVYSDPGRSAPCLMSLLEFSTSLA